MLLSLAVIFLVGLSLASVFQAIRLPRIIGMLATGIAVGPYVLDLLDPTILNISSELRQIALIIILIKAGLSLNLSDLKKVDRPAVLMSFLPACFEILGYICFAPILLGISRMESAVMGAVLSAVSPAVVVPRMVKLIEEKYGTNKSIPQMILAGASCDDVFVIVLFSTFVTMAQGGSADITDFVNIPVSIILGILLGTAVGFTVHYVFEKAYTQNHKIRNSTKSVIILAVSFLLMAIETWLKNYVALSGLLAVVAMACVIRLKSEKSVSKRLSEKFGKMWIPAEVVLFVLVGTAVDIRYTLTAGVSAVAMIFIALAFRAVGVFICTLGTNLSAKERIFCVVAYLPKATVQAAIGSVPMSLGLPCGKIVLSVAVLAILITAPLGAVGIDSSYKKMLSHNDTD
ncbi:MAG: cation:proton antiporter [Ruminococcus flavefaciens]|nr:cation:proton antiporter [Ruminococcus flavefaciens]MCM1230589.1 cation:proton antiporter [Ruminococcus flavefaciens]